MCIVCAAEMKDTATPASASVAVLAAIVAYGLDATMLGLCNMHTGVVLITAGLCNDAVGESRPQVVEKDSKGEN